MKKKIFSLVLALALVLPLVSAFNTTAVGYGDAIDTPMIPLPNHVYTDDCDPYCNTCGEEREITHDFSALQSSEYLHWYNCAVCGTTDDTSYAEHLYDNACDTVCNTCGIPRLITHDYSVQDWNDELHWIKCAVCGTADDSTLAVHYYTDGKDTTCGACGYERTPLYTTGDVDGDSDVDLDDAIYLLYHVNFKDTYPVNQSVDFDGSGTADLDDAIYLLYHVNFKDTYPLH